MSGRPGQVGVLDVGCFSAHLLVVEGSPLHPVLSHKTRLRLDRELDPFGRVTRAGVDQVVQAVRVARRVAERAGVASDVLPFATSVIRDAPNAAEVLAEIAQRTGTAFHVVDGEEEARLAYVAARRWFGHQAGPLLVLDVGGGTVEVALGDDAAPTLTRSLPFGARTLTRSGVVDTDAIRGAVLRELEGQCLSAYRAVACSKVFQQLARLTGARPQRDGLFVPRVLRLPDLRLWIPRLASMPPGKRARLPGISRHRARQSLAGALVAEALMTATGHDEVDICPWSTREGLLISRGAAGDDEICRVA
jgi:exopolyphosphatase / guanosine-5'-triphosphate,3'-diphosphate pyrophosphatase